LKRFYKLKNLLTRFKAQGITIVLTSHILESLVSICDRISYLNGGIIEFTIDQEHFPELEKDNFDPSGEDDLQLQRLLGKD
jgi:ABC-2 type transport system ATP-binding protein